MAGREGGGREGREGGRKGRRVAGREGGRETEGGNLHVHVKAHLTQLIPRPFHLHDCIHVLFASGQKGIEAGHLNNQLYLQTHCTCTCMNTNNHKTLTIRQTVVFHNDLSMIDDSRTVHLENMVDLEC